jgi:hypothetical protein
MDAGYQSVMWDGSGSQAECVGTYFYILSGQTFAPQDDYAQVKGHSMLCPLGMPKKPRWGFLHPANGGKTIPDVHSNSQSAW